MTTSKQWRFPPAGWQDPFQATLELSPDTRRHHSSSTGGVVLSLAFVPRHAPPISQELLVGQVLCLFLRSGRRVNEAFLQGGNEQAL